MCVCQHQHVNKPRDHGWPSHSMTSLRSGLQCWDPSHGFTLDLLIVMKGADFNDVCATISMLISLGIMVGHLTTSPKS